MYADDVMIFLRPELHGLQATWALLHLFGQASGLDVNLAKSCILPVACQPLDLPFAAAHAGCSFAQFPCSYLGMPLSDKRLKRNDLQPLLDKFMKRLACWKAKWISLTGRLTLVSAVLSALPAYQLIALLHPKWLLKQLDKLRRAFLWAASDTVSGGKCLVNWKVVCIPKSLGGLGIPNLHLQGIALLVRWLWQEATDTSKPWHGLPLPTNELTRAVFRASTTIIINNGISTSFWKSHWCSVTPLCSLYPKLFKHSRHRNASVRQALPGRAWISSIKPNPSPEVLAEYLALWAHLDPLASTTFNDQPDSVRWKWTESGIYSASSTYNFLLNGHHPTEALADLWKVKAIPKCRIHAWLLLRSRVLTADNLASRGWPHDPLCKLCNSHFETGNHLFASCSYSRSVWSATLARLHLPAQLTPTADTEGLQEWWTVSSQLVPAALRCRWQSVVLLTWWYIWKERNNRIFNNKARLATDLVQKITSELAEWRRAGVLKQSWPIEE
ncbi:unnamed protein product [Alopecurus aequalis]